VTAAGVVLTLLLQALNPDNAVMMRRAQTKELSDAFGKKLEQLEKFEHDPKLKRTSVTVFESELNSYVRFALAEKVPKGLRDVRIVLQAGRLELRGLADLSQFGDIKDKNASSMSLLSMLTGEMQVEIVADFKSDRGFGQFEVVSAQVGPLPLSPSLVADLVTKATTDASRPNGFDIKAPFRLPYSVKRIRPMAALAVIEY
jgi:hypothetical protein